jgi:ABC-type transport system involved in Fe-S cluster assembly fused permease/ATPase subunit
MVHSGGNDHDSATRAAKETDARRKIVLWIAGGILAWGVILAIGVFLANRDPRQPLIIMACVVIFVGFWLAMLRWRAPQAGKKSPGDFDSNDSAESRD